MTTDFKAPATRHQDVKWFAETVAVPVFLLVIGAFVSSYIIPNITRGWQDHQKELDLKSSLVSEMSNSVTKMIIAAQFEEFPIPPNQKLDTLVLDTRSAYRDWSVNSQVTGSKLRAYYPRTMIGKEWDDCAQLTTDFYRLTGVTEPGDRKSTLAYMESLLSADERHSVDWKALQVWEWPIRSAGLTNAWYELKNAILSRKNDVVALVLNSGINTY